MSRANPNPALTTATAFAMVGMPVTAASFDPLRVAGNIVVSSIVKVDMDGLSH